MAIRIYILKNISSIGYKISPVGCNVRATTLRTLILEKYIEKIILHIRSIVSMFDEVCYSKKKLETLDISLIASASRNIMETVNMYCYFSERKMTFDEIEFRYYVTFLNGDRNKRSILDKLGIELPDSFASHIHKTSKFQYIQVLERNPYFHKLSNKEKELIFSGKNSTHKISSPNILPKKLESGIYNLLSNSVHSLTVGMNSVSFEDVHIFRGLFKPQCVLEISIEVCILYASHVFLDYLDIRKRLYRN